MTALALAAAADPGARDAAVRAMLEAAPHRGSERRFATLGDVTVGVAHTPARPHASISVTDGFLAAVAGRIDNAPDLASAWGAEAGDDAVVLLAGFRRDGDRVAPRLRGAYAAVVTDGHRVWAWRDHFGFGPLFHRATPDGLVAGTEAKQVVAGAGIRYEPDVESIEAVFHHDPDDGTRTALRGVSRLSKATALTWSFGEAPRTTPYWHLDRLVETARLTADDAAERFYELFDQAARRAMFGPDCMALSGGIDSPTIAAFAAPAHREMFGTPLGAVSTIYPDHPSVDERHFIELVAKHLDMPLELLAPSRPHLLDLQEWMRLCDGPVPITALNEIAEHYEYARTFGYHNILTGELAEYFIDRRPFLGEHYVTHGRWGPLWRHVRESHRHGEPALKSVRMVAGALVPRPLRVVADMSRPMRRSPIAPTWLDLEKHRMARAREKPPIRRRFIESQYNFLSGAGIGLEAEEIVQARCDVGCRRPFADVDLVEFFVSLRAEVKYPDQMRKSWVRSLMRGRLPDELLYRPTNTTFDAATLDRIDYDDLRRWLIETDVRISGVDYAELAQRIDRKDFELWDYLRAKDLSGIHAFLSSF